MAIGNFTKRFAVILILVAFVINIAGTMAGAVVTQSNSGNSNAPSSSNGIIQNPLKADSVGELIKAVVEIMTYLAVMVAVVMFVIVGLQFILARGNPEELKKAKDRLLMLVIGVAIVIGAKVIIDVVINTLSATGIVDDQIINSARDAIE